MKPSEREDWRYSTGSINPIDLEEEIMFTFLPEGKEQKLLDVGCGISTISLRCKERGFNVYGIDFSSVAIEKAREKGINVLKADLDKDGIQFEDAFFDVVWAGDILEHVFDPIFLLKEISRVLKQTGKLIISTPNDLNLFTRARIFITGKSPQSDIYRRFGQCKHHTLFSLELLEYMLNEAKLSIKSIGFLIRFPRTNTKRFYNNKLLGRLFGQLFIVEAHKS